MANFAFANFSRYLNLFLLLKKQIELAKVLAGDGLTVVPDSNFVENGRRVENCKSSGKFSVIKNYKSK